MLERELLLRRPGDSPSRGLVYPVVYSDGDHFPPRARETQYRPDLSEFTYPYSCFIESPAYLRFHDAMMSIAAEIENHLSESPEWQANWPVVEPEQVPPSFMTLPRL